MTAPRVDIEQGRALLAKATEGPWRFDGNGDDVDVAALDLWFRNNADALLAELAEARAQTSDTNAAILGLKRTIERARAVLVQEPTNHYARRALAILEGTDNGR